MGEWLFDTPSIFKDSMTPAVNSTDSIESKEDTMTKTAAKTTVNAETIANEKETTMNAAKTNAKTTRKLTREEWKAQYINGLKAIVDELAPKHEGELPEPCNYFHALNELRTGEPAKALYASDLEKKVLALTCLENGWEPVYLTKNQAAQYGGTPKDDAKGIKLHGPNVAKGYLYFNAAEIDWAAGEPAFNGEVAEAQAATYEQIKANRKARAAKRALNKAKADLRAANELAGIKPARKGKKAKAAAAPAPVAAAPEKLLHIKLPNGIEFDARDAAEVKELMALFA